MTALAAAAAAVLGLGAPSVMALSLGRILVQSSLGEPLRAEIDIPEINAEEAASLKASLASPDAFRAAGLEYNPAMSGLRISLQRRADGRAFIRLNSDRAINDPFVDMIIEASWSSGRIVRDYTLLFDPPSMRAPTAPAPTVAQVPAPPPAPAALPATATPAPPAARPASPPRAAVPPPAPAAVPKAAAKPEPMPAGGQQVTVKSGDTASKIASSTKPANVSLDQMLVALLRTNPEAFVNENLNRLKTGAVLNVPDESKALSLAPGEASRTVVAHSRDFNEFRKQLADNAPATQVAAADRQASGSVQTKVEEKKPAATPDKLTLSKGTVESKAAADKLAQDKQAQENANRAAELAKNIKELSKIGAATGAPGAAAPTPGTPVPTPAAPVAPAVPVAAPAPAPASTPASSAPPQAAPTPKPATAVAPTKPATESSFLDELLANPLVAPAAGVLVLLLGGLGLYRRQQSKKANPVDSSFLESRLQPDSFFGASGGQRIDTRDGASTGSSMVYSPSQLDAADDVDPVAEADVYLAYGRDLQAEEILTEALKANPGRLAIHQKLMDIYAKRRDTKGFEKAASGAYKLTNGEGPDWTRACEIGLGIDPTNPLYQPGGKPSMESTVGMPAAAEATSPLDGGAALQSTLATAPMAAVPTPIDLDLDLDFSLDDEPAASAAAAPAVVATVAPLPALADAEATVSMQAAPEAASASLGMDFDLPTPQPPSAPTDDPNATVSLAAASSATANALPDLDMPTVDFGKTMLESDEFKQEAEVSFGSTAPSPLVVSPAAEAPAEADAGMIEFDLGSLSLDLGTEPEAKADAAPTTEPAEAEAPLVTKLALAEEFVAIGDEDGARALIEEVIAESSGDLKAQAEQALRNLS